MESTLAIDLGREALLTTLVISSPVLLVGAVVGLVIGLVQALTQIQDQTVAFVPKLIATGAVLALCLPWLIQKLLEYSEGVITNIPRLVMGG